VCDERAARHPVFVSIDNGIGDYAPMILDTITI
jgi:hypothetical protein